MMSRVRERFEEQLENLRVDLIRMTTKVEEMIAKSIDVLVNRDTALADELIEMDDIVDQLDLNIESECMLLLATQQPMARDLRTIGTIMKMIADVERMADYTVDIARVGKKLAERPTLKPYVDIPHMASIVQGMLRDSLNALIRRDVELARQVCQRDREVDEIYWKVYHELKQFMTDDPSTVDRGVDLVLVARYVERIADHIVNIGERVIYMETGQLKETLIA